MATTTPQRAGATTPRNKPLDAWVRWTHHGNGWAWAVFRGAKSVAEGLERSEREARAAAQNYIEQAEVSQ